jgi:hypothetical protein
MSLSQFFFTGMIHTQSFLLSRSLDHNGTALGRTRLASYVEETSSELDLLTDR